MRYWKRLNSDGTIRTVESYSHILDVEGAIEITKGQFNEYIASLPAPKPEPPSPDTLRAQELLTTSPLVITQPEIWELMRIFGRMHELEF